MYSLKDHIQQPLTESKNVHMVHLEDEILNNGLAGAHIALNFIEGIKDTLAGHGHKPIDVTTKWDGSPAIVCGVNPENGKFFIGTKAVFGKRNPKIIYNKDDIRKHYKDSPGLQKQLELALTHLPKLDINGVLQGDLMFSSSEVDTKTIDGNEYVTFKPNTILYAVPSDSVLAERIRRAKIGIIFHTTYSGETLQEMTPSFKVNINELRKTEEVWVDDATYKDETGTTTLTMEEYLKVKQHTDKAEQALKELAPIRFEDLMTSKPLINMMKMFMNSEIRRGRQAVYHSDYVNGLKKFIDARIDKETTRDATKEKKKREYDDLLKRLEPTINQVLTFQQHITEAKLILINKLQQIETVGTFAPTKDGYRVTKQEGFVAVDHLTNKAIKLVDRLEFSQMNQLRHQQ